MYTNSLINESSPYLLQHAHNPVDWKAWNDETLALAKKENKLLLISVGYSSCHWCHVMEKECFEDEEVAVVMNQHFINVKVDREERPDIDQIYMNAVQLLTQRGGWPLNCVALPDGRPFWGGTYFPKTDWISTLQQIATLYKNDPKKIEEYAENLTAGIQQNSIVQVKNSSSDFSISDLDTAIENWKPMMDFVLGGRNGAPKFPMPTNYEFLLRYALQKNDPTILNYVNKSLTKMAYGGIFDQIGGGFARYAVDNKWHVPHFEKMLYDNGQLVSLYAQAYTATKNPVYKKVVYQTLDFIKNELTSEEGAFYSSLDADSLNDEQKLEEGAFYVWKEAELKEVLEEDFSLFSDYYSINYFGYWENDNYVLIRKKDDAEICELHNINQQLLDEKLQQWRKILIQTRNKRPKPRLDDKILTSWNALMLKGYIDAYKAFNEKEFLETALKNASFIYKNLLVNQVDLLRNFKNGKASINGYLEDYATLIDAFIGMYEITFNELWISTAKSLTDYTFDHFFNYENSMFYFTSDTDTALVTRNIEVEDNVIPASNSIMAHNLFKLHYYYNNSYYLKVSKQMLVNMMDKAKEYASGFSNWLSLTCNFLGDYYEIAICGESAYELANEIHQHYIPNKIIAGSTKKSNLPLLKDRLQENTTLLYVCVDGSCLLPTKNTKETLNQINISFK